MKKKTTRRYRYRSAVTGRFVKARIAKRRRTTTVRERVDPVRWRLELDMPRRSKKR